MWLVKEMLSVFTWILAILGSVSLIISAVTGEVPSELGLYAIIGAFLLCLGYFAVSYADLQWEEKRKLKRPK